MGRSQQSTSVIQQQTACDLVFQMKVTLRGIRPPIWRRVKVTSDTLLWALHGVLQAVMGWNEEHQHRFLINGIYYGESGLSTPALEVIDEESVRLDEVISAENQKFLYQYGSGTGWEHEILIEKILPHGDGERYPTCRYGERACPPEHSGNPWGYREFLKGLKDSSGNADARRRTKGEPCFDPEEFAPAEANRRLGWG